MDFKSAIFTSCLLFINKLEGFISFCTILRWCRYLKPCNTCLSNIMSDLLCSRDPVLQHEVNLFPLFEDPVTFYNISGLYFLRNLHLSDYLLPQCLVVIAMDDLQGVNDSERPKHANLLNKTTTIKTLKS